MADNSETAMPLPLFPFEIWLKIVSFLEGEERCRLYSVNRILFKICMDEKYKQVKLQNPKDVIKSLDLIATSSIACRVRHLDYWPHALAALDVTYIPTFQWESKDARGQASRSSQSRSPRYEGQNPVQDVVDLMSRFSNVSTLTLSSTRTLELPAFLQALPTVTAGWRAFGHNLKKLSLDVTLEGCWRVLSSELTLPNLEELDIKFSKAYLNTDIHSILSTLMGPFVNNHHASLRILQLSAQRYLDISPFLFSIQHLTRLSRFSYSCVLAGERQLDALHHVLSTHASTLQILALRFMNLNRIPRPDSNSEVWSTSEVLSVQMPQLENLDFRMETLPETPQIVEFVQQYESSLTTLILGYKKFTFEEVENITEVFERSGKLKQLNIGVCCLRPALLDILSTHLPNLELLSLLIEYASPDETPETGDPESFEAAMAERSYPKWSVKHFRGVINSVPVGGVASVERALRNSVPSLQTFQLLQARG